MTAPTAAARPAMPGRDSIDDDAPSRWPLVVALFAALGTAALLVFGVDRLFTHEARATGRAARLQASADAPAIDAPPPTRTPRARRRERARRNDAPRPFDPAVAASAAADASNEPDPQLQRSRASAGSLDGGAGSFSGVTHRGRVAQVQGDAPVRAGASCDVRVLPVSAGGFNCLVRVICDGTLLYPNPDQSAGFVTCQVDASGPTTAEDRGYTSQDGDPLLTFDAPSQRIVVGDGGDGRVRDYLATITLEGPRAFRRL